MSKEEEATLNLLHIILSKKEDKYDQEVLKKLLKWGRDRRFFATPRSIFDTREWDRVGSERCEAVSSGPKGTKALCRVWRMAIMELK